MLERPPHFLVCVAAERVKIHAQGAREQDWVLRESEDGDIMQYRVDFVLCPFVYISVGILQLKNVELIVFFGPQT